MPLRIVPLDASDPDAMATWHRTYEDAALVGRALPMTWKLEEKRALFLSDTPGERIRAFTGYDGAVPVTTGELQLPLKDNLHLAGVEVHTAPPHRNRGHGSQMLDHLTALALENGRRTLNTEAYTPFDGAADGSGHPNADFLLHRGFVFGLGDIMRVLDLPADTALLERLAGEAAQRHTGYRLRHFNGAVPGDLVDEFGKLVGAVITEAPTGGLELEPEVFDEERIRADEAVLDEAGRVRYATVALDGDGSAAAYSEVVVPAHDPGRAFQWGTLVLPAHRGHRLGMATKTDNLLRLQAERLDLRELVTFNAEVNQHMVAVNDAIGFRPVERMGEYQKQLG